MLVAMIFLGEAVLAVIALVRFDTQVMSHMVPHIGFYLGAIIALLTAKCLVSSAGLQIQNELLIVKGF